jgi:hypothetical protein
MADGSFNVAADDRERSRQRCYDGVHLLATAPVVHDGQRHPRSSRDTNTRAVLSRLEIHPDHLAVAAPREARLRLQGRGRVARDLGRKSDEGVMNALTDEGEVGRDDQFSLLPRPQPP